ncbi:GFA family protein [Litoreibacter halocynthiae]|uniref:GFA family protein n=1 Tax=Litoreibacter halocynthiae TaxID=1242689 RepID=UPI00249067E9|nr:GFA family protein [Litoreibacter halocynthiae]
MINKFDSESGGCLCGAVRFEVSAEPYFVVICSCRFCQRLTGSDYNVESLFRLGDVEVSRGKTKVHTHRSEGSGKSVHVHFCGACGTALYLKPERFPDCIGILSGTFDNPAWFRRDSSSTEYFFTAEAPRGMVIPEGFNTYPGHAKALDGSDNVPTRQARTELL